MYFRGLGTPQDYAHAVEYLEMDYTANKRYDLLGLCYLKEKPVRRLAAEVRTMKTEAVL